MNFQCFTNSGETQAFSPRARYKGSGGKEAKESGEETERNQSREGGGEPGNTGEGWGETGREGSGAVLPGTLLPCPLPSPRSHLWSKSYQVVTRHHNTDFHRVIYPANIHSESSWAGCVLGAGIHQ